MLIFRLRTADLHDVLERGSAQIRVAGLELVAMQAERDGDGHHAVRFVVGSADPMRRELLRRRIEGLVSVLAFEQIEVGGDGPEGNESWIGARHDYRLGERDGAERRQLQDQ